MGLLDTISSPQDLRKLSPEAIDTLATEIRQEIITVTSENGGHVGPNLGTVELSIALHRVFDTPKDKLLFDVSHQSYTHKLLTGRNGRKFKSIRKSEGISGFFNRTESEHDAFGAGHAGTALSAALGMAFARDARKGDEHIVAVCGDAAFTCGATMEALNNLATSTKRLIVILNDNKWSIGKNVGAFARYMNDLITTPFYNKLDEDLRGFLKKVPGGEKVLKLSDRSRRETKDFFVQSSLFEKFGLRYIGPIDGHSVETLEQYLHFAKTSNRPLLLHVITQKGKGYDVAINNPEKFHGASPYNITTGESKKSDSQAIPNYQDVFGKTLCKLAETDKSIIGITAAMASGTGLSYLQKALPAQFVDVGIAEEHASLFAAGMAASGMKPVVAVYSSFMQRAYDMAIHDICLQNLKVLFCMDRAGLSPQDGATHHGLFDIAAFRPIPNATIMQPRHEDELADMMFTALTEINGPAFIRYPRGAGIGITVKEQPTALPVGKSEILRQGEGIQIWALGNMNEDALAIADRLAAATHATVGIVNARFVKPLDKERLLEQASGAKLIVTMEDGILQGGFGSAVLEALSESQKPVPVCRIGWKDTFIEHGDTVGKLREKHGLSQESMLQTIKNAWDATV